MKEKIAEIAAKHYIWPIKSMRDVNNCDKWADDLADEIDTLYKGEIDKLKEIIAKQDELLALEEQFIVDEVIGTIDITGEDDWDAFKNPANALKNKIKQLKNEAGL